MARESAKLTKFDFWQRVFLSHLGHSEQTTGLETGSSNLVNGHSEPGRSSRPVLCFGLAPKNSGATHLTTRTFLLYMQLHLQSLVHGSHIAAVLHCLLLLHRG